MPNLKIGYKASAEQFGPSDLVNLAVLADDRGLDSVWVSDHFQPPAPAPRTSSSAPAS